MRLCPRPFVPLLLALLTAGTIACPSDPSPREAGVLLSAQVSDAAPLALRRADLESLPPQSVSSKRVIERNGARDEQTLVYGGWLLRDVLARAGFGDGQRGARTWVVEAVATDGYRAVFSWGELYNSALGDQVYVIGSQDGKPLDAVAGPLSLRSLADLRPGARHVRNLCALQVRPLR